MNTVNGNQNVNNVGGEKKVRTSNGPYKKDVFTAFLEWSVLTTKERRNLDIITAKDFSIKYKVHESQLSRWRKREDFKYAKNELQKSKWEDLTPDVIDGLYRRCTRYGTSSDVEFWLAYIEGWDRKKEVKELDKVTLAPDDIRSLTEYLPEEEKKMFWETLTGLLAKASTAEELEKRK